MNLFSSDKKKSEVISPGQVKQVCDVIRDLGFFLFTIFLAGLSPHVFMMAATAIHTRSIV